MDFPVIPEFLIVEDGVKKRITYLKFEIGEFGTFKDAEYTFGFDRECSLKLTYVAEYTAKLSLHVPKYTDLRNFEIGVMDGSKLQLWGHSFGNVLFSGLEEIRVSVRTPYNTLSACTDGKAFIYLNFQFS